MDDIGAISETAGAAALEIAVSAIRERGGEIGPCKNCSTPLVGPYCAACGQPIDTHRRSLFELAHDFIKDIASFDSRILRTVRALLLRPGELPRAYHEGRTQRYVPPVRLYLFVSLFFFVILSMTGIAILQLELVASTRTIFADRNGAVIEIKNGKRIPLEGLKADKDGNVYAADDDDGPRALILGLKADGTPRADINPEAHFFAPVSATRRTASPAVEAALAAERKSVPSVVSKSSVGRWLRDHLNRAMEVLATNPAAVNGPLTEWIPRMLFILLPVFALLLAVFYWRQRRSLYFVDHLVFSLGVHSFVFVALLAAIAISRVLSGADVAWLAIVGVSLYLLLAMKRFYGQSWFWTGAKFTTVLFIYTIFVLLPALAGILVVSLFNL